MKVEIAILAQSLERIAIELQRCRACLSDLLAESVTGASPVPSSLEPMPPLDQGREPTVRRARLYASGALATRVVAILEPVEELSIQALLRTLQVDKPGTQMASLRPCVSNLVKDGQMVRVRTGIYRLADHTPQLSVVAR